MAAPIIPALLAGGALLFAFAQRKKKKKNGGTPAPDDLPAGDGAELATTLPWMRFSTATRGYQSAINAELAAQSFQPIAPDGVLGRKTCAAGKFVSEQFGRTDLAPVSMGADCREYGAPPEPTPEGSQATDWALRATMAMGTGDPATMRSVANELEAEGGAPWPNVLRTMANDIEGVGQT